ncbi:methanol dehydrogenase [Sphingomonas sp. HMP9]|uniref:TPM domain-containing protein n=1 Tax=Sphingomonas sp. HMP9 TaxID=1517554 RepID=UPI001596C7C7|nr:TPM domain-containing protein [Sphingomonas sp. HMP9]BCA63935.1 methanol dehydrogenase [Sphingomonas sp. HMP9]
MIRHLATLVFAVLLGSSAATAQTFPKFTGFVVDSANVIPPDQEAALTRRLDDLQKATGNQLVVATVPDLEGYPIEDYGNRLLRSWGVGLKDANNGAILLVAPNDRKVRIEVGYGLEPVLTDAFSSVVINQQILPRFKAGDISGGIVAGTNAVADQLALPDAEARAKVTTAAAEYDKTHRRSTSGGGGVPIGLIFFGIVLAAIVIPMLSRKAGGKNYVDGGSRSGGSGALPIVLWSVADAMMRGGGGGGGGSSGGGDSGGWGGGGFGGGGGGSGGGGGASGSW